MAKQVRVKVELFLDRLSRFYRWLERLPWCERVLALAAVPGHQFHPDTLKAAKDLANLARS